jgi:glucose-6-phosphate 1-epimerase
VQGVAVTARVEPIDFHGLPALRLFAGDGSSAVLCEHGAHLVSWLASDGREHLYLSPRSQFANGVAIRGGIPVIFPQFGAAGPLPRHGFARTAAWTPGAEGSDGVSAWATMHLRASDATRQVWSHDFAASIALRLGASQLEVTLRVENTGSDAFSFSAALHTYLAVESVGQTCVVGLQGQRYRDNVAAVTVEAQVEPLLRVDDALDRIYFDVPPVLSLRSPSGVATLTSRGFPDAVVWNPGPRACAALPDMPVDGWQHMLCIEAAAIGRPPALAPGQFWSGSQRIDRLGIGSAFW